MTEPLRGETLFRAALEQIKREPKQWNQSFYHHCGTQHCFLGWCDTLIGNLVCPLAGDTFSPFPEEPSLTVWSKLLGITEAEARWIYGTRRTIADFEAFAAAKWPAETLAASKDDSLRYQAQAVELVEVQS